MNIIENQHLLRNKKVLDEIGRHQWIESEKRGYDIGFDKAAEEWLVNFSKEWMEYHIPSQTTSSSKVKSAAKGAAKRARKTSVDTKLTARTKNKK